MEELKILQKTERLHEARWWEAEPGGRVLCYLCPRHCHIHPGQAGFCLIRPQDRSIRPPPKADHIFRPHQLDERPEKFLAAIVKPPASDPPTKPSLFLQTKN